MCAYVCKVLERNDADHGWVAIAGERNIPLAIEYWRRASELGDKNALYSVAMCARVGEGMQKDSQFAFSTLLALAEEHNNPMAHFAVGDMYSKGEGTEENQTKSFEHFNVSAFMLFIGSGQYFLMLASD